MSGKPIGDLRRRMIAGMTIGMFSEKTQRDYTGGARAVPENFRFGSQGGCIYQLAMEALRSARAAK